MVRPNPLSEWQKNSLLRSPHLYTADIAQDLAITPRTVQRFQQALADNPQLELKRLPSYSPQVNVIERFWKLLRRRATHNRLFDSLADLKRSIRASLCYFPTVRPRIETLIAQCYPRPANQTSSAGP